METITVESIPIVVGREEDGRWWADIESMPGVMAYGGTRDAAIAAVRALALRVAADCNDILDSLVGLVIRGLKFAVWTVCGIGLMVEAAVGQRTAQAFVKKQEQKGDLDSLCRELIGIAAAIALKHAMAFQFAQIVAKLVQSVAFRG